MLLFTARDEEILNQSLEHVVSGCQFQIWIAAYICCHPAIVNLLDVRVIYTYCQGVLYPILCLTKTENRCQFRRLWTVAGLGSRREINPGIFAEVARGEKTTHIGNTLPMPALRLWQC